MVVVEREQPAHALGRRRRLGADRDDAVRRLPRPRELDAAVDGERLREQPVAERARRVARRACRECERVRAARCDRELEASTLERVSAASRACRGRRRGRARRAPRPRVRCSRSMLPQARQAFVAARHRPAALEQRRPPRGTRRRRRRCRRAARGRRRARRARGRDRAFDATRRRAPRGRARRRRRRRSRSAAIRERRILISTRSWLAGDAEELLRLVEVARRRGCASPRSSVIFAASTCARARLSVSSVVSSSAIALRMFVSATAPRPSACARRASDQYRRTRMYGSSVSRMRSRRFARPLRLARCRRRR